MQNKSGARLITISTNTEEAPQHLTIMMNFMYE